MLDDGDDTFFLLGMEAVESDDMVDETEFEESFLSMATRVAQSSVLVAVRGVCCKGQSCRALIFELAGGAC